MVRIRLRRVGRKKQPSFRLVAADRESPRDGRFLEILGFYNPRTEPATIKLKEDRIYHWMSVGAQPSDAANSIMRVAGTLERYERFKTGEDVEKLLEEAAAGDATRNISSKTRHESPVGKPKAEPKAEAPAVEEPKAKEETPAEEVKAEEAKEEVKAEEEKVEEAPEEKKAEPEEPKEEVKAEEEKVEEAPAEEPKAKEAKEKPKAEEEKVEEAPEISSSRASVDKLELPDNITSVLVEGDYKTIGKLAKQMEADTQPILDLSGIGPKALETIEEKLKEFQA